jgi:DNA-binding NtrC family response regulator
MPQNCYNSDIGPTGEPAAPLSPQRGPLLGDSPAMRRLRSQIQRVAPYFRTALVRGETGTGKELVARAIHQLSPGADGPFVPCPIATLADSLAPNDPPTISGLTPAGTALLESAQGGTLYLDEIGELPYPLQAGLLRFLKAFEDRRIETRRWELRIIASTHRDLRTLSAIGQFRPDLYTRLSVIEIAVPSLRQRTEDIPALAAQLLRRIARKSGDDVKFLAPETLTRLQRHPWPGNLHELRKVLVRAAARTGSTLLEPRHLIALTEPQAGAAAAPLPVKIERLQDVIQQHVLSVLTRCAGNKLRAAELLGISRSTLYRMLDTNAPTPLPE